MTGDDGIVSNTRRALSLFARHRSIAILRTDERGAVARAMEAAIDGGFRIVEFTLNTPGALEQIAALSERPELLVGAGTVLSVPEAREARAAGARFLVSPVSDDAVIRYALDHDLLMMPGTFTPTEMLAAHRAGAAMVKLFPAPPGGPAHIRACLGPLPFLKIVPTSGVTGSNAAEFLAAGAFALGFVNCLFAPEDVAAGRFEAITGRARSMVATVAACG